MKMTFQEIRIITTGPCIANQLRDVNTTCRRSWYIAAHIWKIYDFKIEVVAFIKKIHETRAFNFTYRYIDDVLSINNPRFAEFLPLIYHPELVACFSDKDDVSRNQNNCYWPMHNESIARCKHHMQEKLVYCCSCLENLIISDAFSYSENV
jgi:hypothetical protein